MTEEQQLKGMKSLSDYNPHNFVENYKNNLKLDWVFNKTYEKIILVVCFLWTVFSITKFIWSLFQWNFILRGQIYEAWGVAFEGYEASQEIVFFVEFITSFYLYISPPNIKMTKTKKCLCCKKELEIIFNRTKFCNSCSIVHQKNHNRIDYLERRIICLEKRITKLKDMWNKRWYKSKCSIVNYAKRYLILIRLKSMLMGN